MGHFYGTLQGSATTSATRQGSKTSGMSSTVESWGVKIKVDMVYIDGEGRRERNAAKVELRSKRDNLLMAMDFDDIEVLGDLLTEKVSAASVAVRAIRQNVELLNRLCAVTRRRLNQGGTSHAAH